MSEETESRFIPYSPLFSSSGKSIGVEGADGVPKLDGVISIPSILIISGLHDDGVV